MEATINFLIPEFNSFGSKKKSFKELETAESTFNNILNSLGRTFSKNWQSIEFEFNNKNILVCRHWLIETDFNWNESHQIQ